MIPIKIKGRKYKIKRVSELTTQEFIDINNIEDLDYVKYIAYFTKKNYNDAFFAVVSKSIENAIGLIPDITKMKRPKGFDYSKTIETVGQRHQVEAIKKTGLDLLVYTLAVAQCATTDATIVKKTYQEYLKQPFKKILPAGFFFLQDFTKWQKLRAEEFVKVAALDRHQVLKEKAGQRELDQYAHFYEIQTLCDFLNTDHETILESQDIFCTKILIANLKKSIFEQRFAELLHEKR